MIGGGRIKVSDLIRASGVDGSGLIGMLSGCDGGCDSKEFERCGQFESLRWGLGIEHSI